MLRRVLASACLVALSSPSLAEAQDLVVMRKVMPFAPTPRNEWRTGPWVGGDTCSESTPQSRQVQCVSIETGKPVSDAACKGSKPQTDTRNAVYSGCGYGWSYSAYGPFADACSDSTSRTRTATCMRSGGTSMPIRAEDSACAGVAPKLREDAANYAGCGYAWTYSAYGPFAEACSDLTYRTRTTTCTRSGGSSVPATVDRTLCTSPADKTQEQAANYSGCDYAWKVVQGACSGTLRTQTVTCQRSGGSTSPTLADDAQCSAKPKPPSTVTDPECRVIATRFVNGDFQSGFGSWTTSNWVDGGSSSFAIETANGSSAAALSISNSTSGVQLSQTVDAKAGDTVTISFDYAIASGSYAGSLLVSARNTAGSTVYASTNPTVVATKPTRGSLSFTVPAGVTKMTVFVHAWSLGPRNNTEPTKIYVDNFVAS